MPKTGADLSLSAQVTTTKPVTATAPVTPTVTAKDIVDTAVADGRFKTLVAAVQAAGLVDTLKGKGPFTVFAPTDDAFAKLPAGTVEALLKDPAKLKDILLYHVVSGNVTAADAAKLTSANTVQGKPITIKAEGGKLMINDATVAIADVKTSNGVIHVIDKVILPPAAAAPVTATKPVTTTAVVTATKATTVTTPAAAAPAPATMPKTGADLSLSAQVTTTKPVTATAPVTPTVTAKDIVDTAVADGRFKTLVAAVQAAGLVDTLKGKGPFTVFAPTDDAFAKLPAGTVEALLKDPAKLKDILLYHVVSGNVMAADAAKLTSANTVQGKPITIKAEGGKLMINDATVAIADVKTSNGVIHVIDKVILPPAAAAPVTATKPVTTTAVVTATKATTVTTPAAAAPAPATMPKTGADLSLSAQVTTTKPVTATAPVTPTVTAKDIVDTAVADGRFKTLVAAVQAAGLVDTLKGKGPFTVFAPSDEAFAKLPAGTVEALLKDPAKLKDILLYHVVSGNVMAADAAKLTSANTVQGKPITIKAEGGKLMINDATVAIADVKTSNGVIHVIDKVILPPAAAAPVTATKATTTTVPAAAAAPAPAPATMPKTGGEMGLLVLSGLSLLGISAGLAIRGRRR